MVPEQPTLDVDAVFTEHMEAPAPPIDEPHTEHMDDAVAPEHIDEPLSPERGSPAQVGEKAEVVEKEAEFESFDAPSFEAPNFKEEARAGDGQVRVATHGWSRSLTTASATPSTCRPASARPSARARAVWATTPRCASSSGRKSRSSRAPRP